MAIVFDSDLVFPNTPAVSCSCAQNMPRFDEVLDVEAEERPLPAELVEHIREHAFPDCARCGGSGLVEGASPHASFVQVNSAVLGALGLEAERGSCTIPEARRALMRARSRRLAPFVIPAEVEHGKPVVHENGVVELRPVRFQSFEVCEDRIGAMVDRVADLVERLAAAGATQIRWY